MLPSNTADFESTNPSPNKRGPGGGLFVTLALLIALIAVIAFAVTRLPTGTLSRLGQSAAPTDSAARQTAPTAVAVVNGVPADATTQQVIQDVIQKLDEAQAQAIATKDSNVMAPTATAEFLQQQVATNQDLLANGVTDIKLISLEWGAITVAGNSANATVYETWSTTFDDGTTEQARDRNVYTLVLDNGTWKVQADDHPDQSAGGSNPTPAP